MELKDKYALVGEFVSEFEAIVTEIRTSCIYFLVNEDIKDTAFAVNIFSQKIWSADPLLEMFKTMGFLALKFTNENYKVKYEKELIDFCKAFSIIITFRNKLLNGDHFYARADTEDMTVLKKVPGKFHGGVITVISSSVDLIKYIDTCKQLKETVGKLSHEIRRHQLIYNGGFEM